MAEPRHDRRSILIRALALPAAFLIPARPGSAAGREACEPTGSDFKGPMYAPGAPRRSVLAGPDEPGDRLRIRGTVFAPDCRTPVSRALLDVWQADAAGRYHDEREAYRLRGQILTDGRGQYQIDTIRPGGYGGRPAHIHFTVGAPGHEPLTTQLYFRGDPVLDHDACGPACNSDDPHRIIALARLATGFAGTFDFVLKASSA